MPEASRQVSEPRIVTPEEAHDMLDEALAGSITEHRLAYTVATERERHETETRAAVVKALRWASDMYGVESLDKDADAIENGADYA